MERIVFTRNLEPFKVSVEELPPFIPNTMRGKTVVNAKKTCFIGITINKRYEIRFVLPFDSLDQALLNEISCKHVHGTYAHRLCVKTCAHIHIFVFTDCDFKRN